MDVLLENGGHVLDRLGAPERVDGARELLQRAAIRLTVRKGALPHDPAFGSRLSLLNPAEGRHALDTRALAAAREALAPLPGVEARRAECVWDARTARLGVRVLLALNAREYTLEVGL